ncbi:hypothetical protein MLD38_015288 [Melastoma candidum]|uniref:Uncharacterized protein n=1 Tax=Melastoma candidum TaxID=119954 RepID=A0ACB9RJT0_9MYRT|nr:hypothetical protein MLD38_015288 [Melastoma candidum]
MVISTSNPHQKEISIRRKFASIFNKREEDFPSLREYNDYLEEVEEMVVNYIEGVDVPLIEEKMLKYEEENAEQIMINRAKKAEELSAALAAAKGLPLQTDADGVHNQGSQSEFSTVTQGYAPTVAGGQPRPMGQPGISLEMQGYDEEEMAKLRAEKGGRAGGWSVEFSRKRAIEEAFGSLWI